MYPSYVHHALNIGALSYTLSGYYYSTLDFDDKFMSYYDSSALDLTYNLQTC